MISYASKATTATKQNYCPIETEALSILFACNKFHQFVYGTHFIVENDHKPLKQIFKKSITKSAPGIQRFLLALQKGEFDLNYIPGRESVIADKLSHASLSYETQEITDTEMNMRILKQYPMSDHSIHIEKKQVKLQSYKLVIRSNSMAYEK